MKNVLSYEINLEEGRGLFIFDLSITDYNETEKMAKISCDINTCEFKLTFSAWFYWESFINLREFLQRKGLESERIFSFGSMDTEVRFDFYTDEKGGKSFGFIYNPLLFPGSVFFQTGKELPIPDSNRFADWITDNVPCS